MSRRNKILTLLLLLSAGLFAACLSTYYSLQGKISKRLETGRVIPPLELYSQGLALSVGRRFPLAGVQDELTRKGLHVERDYWLGAADGCARISSLKFKDTSQQCFWLRDIQGNPLVVTWDEAGFVQEIWAGSPLLARNEFALFPRLITQFFDGQPIMQQNTPLSEVPLTCLQAVTAIEDRDFLEHGGVSATGILRAIMRDIRSRSFAEGGSTITQQLVKNFFLTSKKTMRRKLEEQALAVMLESQLNKDQILEMYLNVIYMGQSGPYQVRGFASAALNYFARPISELGLADCALLAAIINNPGRISPFTNPDAARNRRDLVLRKMQEAQMLTADEVALASRASLPQLAESSRHDHAPYFVMAALKEYAALGLETEEGARLYTSLDPEVQVMMGDAVARQLPAVEARIKKPSHQPLQVAALSVDLSNGQVLALIGGRDFKTTQFNRAVDSRRQIGSIVKPFVYWSALKAHDPLTAVLDEPFEWKTGKQVWRPKNFEKRNLGKVPYFYALAHSLNVPAARIGQEVGLDEVANTLKAAGIEGEIPNLPSLTLGALELSPHEVAQAYLTLARLGVRTQVHTLTRVEDLSGKVLHAWQDAPTPSLDPATTAVLVGMMEQSLRLGTAITARAAGLTGALAGKTGTTSDTKDAWFAGFSPRLLNVVWVGYDDNTVMGLTGAGAALPIWIDLTKAAQGLFVDGDFAWPEGVRVKDVSRSSLREDFPGLDDLPEEVQLVFMR